MEYQTSIARLALEIAEKLNDRESLKTYEIYARTYTEKYLRSTLERALQTPEDKIRKSRGALFTFLLKQNANTTAGNNRT